MRLVLVLLLVLDSGGLPYERDDEDEDHRVMAAGRESP
jgi:hypothetical protein